jgi:hypothetical protein
VILTLLCKIWRKGVEKWPGSVATVLTTQLSASLLTADRPPPSRAAQPRDGTHLLRVPPQSRCCHLLVASSVFAPLIRASATVVLSLSLFATANRSRATVPCAAVPPWPQLCMSRARISVTGSVGIFVGARGTCGCRLGCQRPCHRPSLS